MAFFLQLSTNYWDQKERGGNIVLQVIEQVVQHFL